MSRHQVDHRAAPEAGRLKHYYRLEKQSGAEGSHTAAQTLHQRPATRDGGERLRQFLRISRGWTA